MPIVCSRGFAATASSSSNWMAEVEVPEDGRVPVLDDERLITAPVQLWDQLDEAGVRGTGAAFNKSEQELREKFSEYAEKYPSEPGESS